MLRLQLHQLAGIVEPHVLHGSLEPMVRLFCLLSRSRVDPGGNFYSLKLDIECLVLDNAAQKLLAKVFQNFDHVDFSLFFLLQGHLLKRGKSLAKNGLELARLVLLRSIYEIVIIILEA